MSTKPAAIQNLLGVNVFDSETVEAITELNLMPLNQEIDVLQGE